MTVQWSEKCSPTPAKLEPDIAGEGKVDSANDEGVWAADEIHWWGNEGLFEGLFWFTLNIKAWDDDAMYVSSSFTKSCRENQCRRTFFPFSAFFCCVKLKLHVGSCSRQLSSLFSKSFSFKNWRIWSEEKLPTSATITTKEVEKAQKS